MDTETDMGGRPHRLMIEALTHHNRLPKEPAMKDLIKFAEAMSTADLERLIEQLGALRATRQPPVTDDYGYGKAVAPVLDPKFWTQMDAIGTVIALRHPGFGWLWFLLPPNERDTLIRAWSAHREIGNAPPPPNKLN